MHHVPDAAGGKLAAEREPFDLAILDLMLPDGSGYDVAGHCGQTGKPL